MLCKIKLECLTSMVNYILANYIFFFLYSCMKNMHNSHAYVFLYYIATCMYVTRKVQFSIEMVILLFFWCDEVFFTSKCNHLRTYHINLFSTTFIYHLHKFTKHILHTLISKLSSICLMAVSLFPSVFIIVLCLHVWHT